MKLSPLGKHLWSKRFGGLGSERALATAVGMDGGVVMTGAVGSDVDLGGGLLVGAGGDDVLVGAFGP